MLSLLDRCKVEFTSSCENGDSNRKLVKLLQDLAGCTFDRKAEPVEIENFLRTLWNHPFLLEDCILVSGIIFAKLNPTLNYSDLFEKAQVGALQHSGDWVSVALIRGLLLNNSVSSGQLEELFGATTKAVDVGLLGNRTVLVSRHFENMLHIFNAESSLNSYNAAIRGSQILSLVSRTLRLKADLTDYKCRDLVKFHVNFLNSQQNTQTAASLIEFTNGLLECLPEMNKISIQIYCSLIPSDSDLVQKRIFDLCVPCLKYLDFNICILFLYFILVF